MNDAFFAAGFAAGLAKRAQAVPRERSDAPLSDAMMKKMVPVFVDKGGPEADHKCGSCFMRVLVGKGDVADCTVVSGGIHLTKGTCRWWGEGPASKLDAIHEHRMSHDEAGYIEVPEGVKIQCGTCNRYDPTGQPAEKGHCTLWNGTVKKGQCCMQYKSPEEYVPEQGAPGKESKA